MTIWAWFRHALGLDIRNRVDALEQRKAVNESAVIGAIEAFRRMAGDDR